MTLEGIDGCGKSTQAKLLAPWFLQQGVSFLGIREPGATPAGEAVRQVLLDNRFTLSLEGELLLYMAARTEMVSQVLIPALEKGMTVLCDRFTDSTLAYQGYGAGGDLDWITGLNKRVTKGISPDLTILFDLPVKEAEKRQGGQKDRMESKDYSFHCRVRDGYLALAAKEPERIKVVDARDTKENINKKIRLLIEPFINRLGGS